MNKFNQLYESMKSKDKRLTEKTAILDLTKPFLMRLLVDDMIINISGILNKDVIELLRGIRATKVDVKTGPLVRTRLKSGIYNIKEFTKILLKHKKEELVFVPSKEK